MARKWRICLPVLEMHVLSLGRKDPLEEEMARNSSILVWEIPRTEEPGGLQSMGLQSQIRLSDCTWAHYTYICICVYVFTQLSRNVTLFFLTIEEVFSWMSTTPRWWGIQSHSSLGPLFWVGKKAQNFTYSNIFKESPLAFSPPWPTWYSLGSQWFSWFQATLGSGNLCWAQKSQPSFHQVLWNNTSLRSWDLPGALGGEGYRSYYFQFSAWSWKFFEKALYEFKLLKPNTRERLRVFFC